MFLFFHKDKDTITEKSGVSYGYKCTKVDNDEEYIAESARTFGERFKEQFKASFPNDEHSNMTGYPTSVDNFSIVGMESQNLSRPIKEAIFI